MSQIRAAFSRALEPETAAEELVGAVESSLDPGCEIAGALLLATVASGAVGPAIGWGLAARWPEAEILGTSFEGVLGEGRVFRDEPAAALIAWTGGPEEPIAFSLDPVRPGTDQLAHDLLATVGRAELGPDDLLLVFPDALQATACEQELALLVEGLGAPTLAGAGAVGAAGSDCLAWHGEAHDPGATLGLLIPSAPGREASGSRGALASGSRFASPWLEIGACRDRWIDSLDGEPPLVWIRRQLGLGEGDSIEPFLGRLLIRLRDQPVASETGDPASLNEEAGDYVEHYVVGFDPARGSISLPGEFRRGGQLALALPDADRSRVSLRAAVDGLAESPVVLQLACRARDAALHGDPDIESAVVASHVGSRGKDRSTIGVLAPFQLAPGEVSSSLGAGLASGGTQQSPGCRMRVHSTLLAALGQA